MNKEELKYLTQKINGIRNNPKRLFHEGMNFVQGRLTRMLDTSIPDAEYWKLWSDANQGVSVLQGHINSETEVGKKLFEMFEKIYRQLRARPGKQTLENMIETIKILKTGFEC